MRAAITPLDTKARREQYVRGAYSGATARNLAMRYRWDLFHEARRTTIAALDLYRTRDINDDHIDSALRAILNMDHRSALDVDGATAKTVESVGTRVGDSDALASHRRYVVEGAELPASAYTGGEAPLFMSDGKYAPFVIFDVLNQQNLPGQYPTRGRAEIALIARVRADATQILEAAGLSVLSPEDL